MERLPSEILQLIFSSFPLEYQVSNFRPVCSTWAEAVDTSPAWLHYSFEIDCTEEYDLVMLENMPSLQVLQITKVNAATCEVLRNLSFKLRILQIQGKDPELNVSKVAGIISSYSYSLQNLCVSSEIFSNSECAKAIAQCVILEELALLHPYSYKCDRSLRIIADSVCPLKKFYFCRYLLSSITLNYFFHKKGKNLTSLIFSHIGVDCHKFSYLNYCLIELNLKDNSSDETEISNQEVTEEFSDYRHFYWIESVLNSKTLSNLTELSIQNFMAMHRMSVRSIFYNCRLLVALELEMPALIDLDFDEIHQCTNLSSLRIVSVCPLTGEGLSHIAKCSKLSVLYIRILRPVDDLAVNSLLTMKNLITLELPKATLPEEFYSQIASNMTNLRTIWVFTLPESVHQQMQTLLPGLTIRSVSN